MSQTLTALGLILFLTLPIWAQTDHSQSRYFSNLESTPAIWDLIEGWSKASEITQESALHSFPRSMRINYVLMRLSGSFQESDVLNPRAIISEVSGSLVATVTGHSGLVGGERIEIFAFDNTKEGYEPVEALFRDGKVTATSNRAKCVGCHTDIIIPNWRQYSDWNGSYGGGQDRFGPQSRWFKTNKGFESFLVMPPREQTDFESFLHIQRSHPRYSALARPNLEPKWPFIRDLSKFKGRDDYDYSPNRRLGIGLGFHHARILGVRLKKSDLFKTYPANVTGALLRCRSESFLLHLLDVYEREPLFETPENLRAYAHEGTGFYEPVLHQLFAYSGIAPDQWVMDLSMRSERILPHWVSQLNANGIGIYSMTTIEKRVGFYLFEEMKKSFKELQTIQKEGATKRMSYDMYVPISVLQRLDKVIPHYLENTQNAVCAALEPLQIAELKQKKPFKNELSSELMTKAKERRPYVLRQCAACHSGDGTYAKAPFIPFFNDRLLRMALKTDPILMSEIEKRTDPAASEDIRMPRGPIGLHPDLRDELISYLRDLVK